MEKNWSALLCEPCAHLDARSSLTTLEGGANTEVEVKRPSLVRSMLSIHFFII